MKRDAAAADLESQPQDSQQSYGGWTPAPGESPAEREKRLKREKRAKQLGQSVDSFAPSTSHAASAPAPAPSLGATRRQDEDYGGWKPAEGESPAEREKRMKREKRAAKLAELNRPAQGGRGHAARPPPPPPAGHTGGGDGGARRADEDYGGWQPMEGESPAEREKRIKREKRAAMLASQSQSQSQSQGSYDASSASGFYPPPPHLSQSLAYSSSSSYPPTSYSSAPAQAQAADQTQEQAQRAEEDKKSKHAQSKTPARLKYLERKKKVRKAKRKALPKAAHAAGSARAPSVDGSEAPVASAVGEKRKREEEDASSGEEDDDDQPRGGKADSEAAGEAKWADLSPEEREAKAALVAEKKAERREKRLAKKAELKALKAAGLPAPLPKARVVERTKPLARMSTTKVVPPPADEEEKEKEPTEEEKEEAKKREEIRLRKDAKALKKAQRRLPTAPEPDAQQDASTTEVGEDGDTPMLIPTAPSAESASAEPDSALPPPPAAVAEPEPLYRLPSSTRPAPPSLATLSALRVHEQVRGKVIVDPLQKAELGESVGSRGRKRLTEMGVEGWFAVQTATLPLLLPTPPNPFLTSLYPPHPLRDLLVSAPTGSGKTLSYVVPIVEVLQKRTVTRLRALVLLPTRDLVGQVRETFEAYGRGAGLKIGVATGQHSFAHEQSVLVGDDVPSDLRGGSSLVDILIATPGRLMDHLKSTPGFSLQHLRFLVVDEADRLLTQSFHDWLPTVLAALKPPSGLPPPPPANEPVLLNDTALDGEKPLRFRPADSMSPLWWDSEGAEGRLVKPKGAAREVGCCQKLLFSATLSRDPAKIAALQLHRPIFISVEDSVDAAFVDGPSGTGDAAAATGALDVDAEKRFTFPPTLKEFMLISPSTHKPLNLFHLLHHPDTDKRIDKALCFTKSVEAATRLAKLVELFQEAYVGGGGGEGKREIVVRAFSSGLAPGERKKVLKEFKEGKITLLIASDLISRGIDLPSVSHVISYDIPSDMRKYVHRVGRTARAGAQGSAWSLVEEQEVAPFKSIMNAAQHYSAIQRVKVKDREVEHFVPAYQTALEKLRLFFATGGAIERGRAEQQH
ncbi:hypothetical protein JCM11641_007113 [Rhodosporidiobolus odoratus]